MTKPEGVATGEIPPGIPPGGQALGHDPLDDEFGLDPFIERLDSLDRASSIARPRPPLRPAPQPRPEIPTADRSDPPEPARLPRRRRTTTPSLAEIEQPGVRGWLDRMLGDDERRRLSALTHLVEGEAPFDRFGFSPDTLRASFPLFYALYRFYFRVQSRGHENLPKDGPAILVGNHGGLLPFDAAMGIVDTLLHTDPPRLARAIVDRWAGELPWINIFYARVGQVIGTRENFADLLDDGQLVLVFPEGIEGIRKTITQRYRLQRFRVGFIEQALRAQAPIVPVAFIGSDDQTPILYDLKPLARRLGLPVAPITPTFPWFGPLGLLPYPVKYEISYGEPFRFYEEYPEGAADDPHAVRYMAERVRRRIQELVDRGALARRSRRK